MEAAYWGPMGSARRLRALLRVERWRPREGRRAERSGRRPDSRGPRGPEGPAQPLVLRLFPCLLLFRCCSHPLCFLPGLTDLTALTALTALTGLTATVLGPWVRLSLDPSILCFRSPGRGLCRGWARCCSGMRIGRAWDGSGHTPSHRALRFLIPVEPPSGRPSSPGNPTHPWFVHLSAEASIR